MRDEVKAEAIYAAIGDILKEERKDTKEAIELLRRELTNSVKEWLLDHAAQKGEKGDPGPRGAPGADGQSVYVEQVIDLLLEDSDFRKSLVGPAGPQAVGRSRWSAAR